MTSETYPNGMTATYGYDPTGYPTSLVYTKETHCTEKCEWFKDTVMPSIHDQWASQTSSFGKQNYTYDTTGRLTQVQEEPVGKGCITRTYTYDEDTNRTGLTIYPPGSKNECSTENPTVEKHTYDEADRLTDSGVEYEPFGNTTTLPVADAGGSKLSSTFYVNNKVATQEQAGETIGYNLDPAGRTKETVSTGKITADETNYYAGPGSAPAWSSEPSGKWKRYIPGINGSLAAIDNNGETVLELPNLHGDIIATAYLSETTTGLASTIKESTEYGVPSTEAPPRYSWLGAHEIPTQLPSGVSTMGARTYVPQLGRFLQTDPIPGATNNSYAYTNGNPVNEADLTGMYDATISTKLIEANTQEANEAVARAIAAEEAARAEAEREAAAAAAYAAADAAMHAEWAAQEASYQAELSGYYGEEEEWEEEGGGNEYAAYHPGTKGQQEAYAEPAFLEEKAASFGPGVEGQSRGTHEGSGSDVVPLCEGSMNMVQSPCARDASIFGKIWHWVKHNIHKLVAVGVGAISTIAVGGATLLATTGCAASAAITADPFEAFDCYKVAAFGGTLTFAVAASTLQAWSDVKN